MKDTFLAFVGALVRHALTAAGGAGALQGAITSDTTTAIVSGVVAAVGLAWSWFEKRNRTVKP